jgi:hypothetical protein
MRRRKRNSRTRLSQLPASLPKISAAIWLVSIADGMPQYIATSSRSCSCDRLHPFAGAPLAWTRNSADRLLAAVIASEGRYTHTMDMQRSLRPRI